MLRSLVGSEMCIRDRDDTHAYLDRIDLSQTAKPNWERLINLIHALDHLQRLHERCEEDEDRVQTVNQIANGQIDVLTGTARLEAIRWLRRVSKHVTRSTFHLYQAILAQ